jgi:phosphate transport system substrate-binding protein
MASAARSARVGFSRDQLYQALARDVVKDGVLVPNPHRRWREVDPSLPDVKIEVIGPPSTSGTRDSFEQLAIKPACEAQQAVRGLAPERRDQACTTLRRDGHFIELGEDDVETVKRLKVFTNAFGIFGYSYALRYEDIVRPNPVDGILPTDETIASGAYPLSRPLFLYVKDARVGSTPGLREFLEEYASDKALGPEGYLTDIGLVPLDDGGRAAARSKVARLLSR